MCDRSFMLVIFLILKIIILIITPIALFVLYKKESKVFNLIGGLDIVFIILFIVLKLSGNPCVSNSNFSYIRNHKDNIGVIDSEHDPIYSTVQSTKKYFVKEDKNAYYYDINSKPLSRVKLSCDKKNYMSSYGDSISALTTLIANHYNLDINIINAISYLDEAKLINCDTGIDFDSAAKVLAKEYRGTIKQIAKTEIDKYLSNGESVLVETKNIYTEEKNFGCEKDYIVIYNLTNEGEYNIINPNDKDIPYFCPSNTIGYGSIIEENQNERVYTINDIDSKATRYFVLEVK